MNIRAMRFAPGAAISIVLAVVIGLVAAQAGAGSADAMRIDMDTAGNTPAALGTIEDCAEVNAGGNLTLDVVVQNIPSGAAAAIGFNFNFTYDSNFTVTTSDAQQLLGTRPNSSVLDASDPVPDADGQFKAAVADTGPLPVSAEIGSGVLMRLTLDVDAGTPNGEYNFTLTNAYHVDTANQTRVPNEVFGGRVAVGMTCESLGTPTPSASPSPTPAPFPVGDVDCTGSANSVDALKILRYVAQLSVSQTEPCDDINTGGPPLQGDVDCSGGVNSVDSLKILRYVAQLSVSQTEPCDDIGT
jgi:hypothetical protein